MTKRIAPPSPCLIFVFGCMAVWMYTAPTSASTELQQKLLPSDQGAQRLFAKDCATCHGKDGQAKTFKAKFNHARNLTDATWQANVTDERLFNSISHGRDKMPAFGKKLSEADLNSLVAFVRALKK